MTPLRCCVIDDEPLAAELIANYVARTPQLELAGVFHSPTEAFPMISGEAPDVIFLDIQMPQLSGLEMARIIPEGTSIVFTTAYANYAVDSYNVNASGYLLKPISYTDFSSTMERIIKNRSVAPTTSCETDSDFMMIKTEYRLRQIKKSDILFVEGLKDYVKIYMADETHPVISLLSLKTLERNLPGHIFMRVHRSYIVNLQRISTIERGIIHIGNTQIPVSDSFRPVLQNYISSHLPE